MSGTLEDALVDLVIEEGYLSRPEALLQSLRDPSGRRPSETAMSVSAALAKLDDPEALCIVRAVLDAATFSVFSLLDHDFKNAGLHALFFDENLAVDTQDNPSFWQAYRSRVEPNGLLSRARTPS
ncbi:MAG TPA: hypothetical protein VGD66_04520 [Allosphingosinicella sp.]|jgi:hypothetical protein